VAFLATKSSNFARSASFGAALCLSAGALGVSLCFFAPHLWLMRTVVPGSFEWARGLDYLRRCQDPFASNVVPAMRWRFLPQLIAYGLHLGMRGCLVIPWLGVVALTLGCAMILLRAPGVSSWAAFAGLVLVTTTSPILCSTGWLGINDCWMVGGLVLIAFTASPVWIAVATLVVPWIDERFWFGLPAAWLIRSLQSEGGLTRRDWAVLAAAAIPCVAIRFWGLRHGSADPSAIFLREESSGILLRLNQAPMGCWMGVRWAILPVVLVWEALWRRWGALGGALAAATLAGPLFVLAMIASDSMRSTGIALPWVLYGYIAFVRRTGALRWAVGLAGLQLLTPAAQVSADKDQRIDSLPVELIRLQRPPQSAVRP